MKEEDLLLLQTYTQGFNDALDGTQKYFESSLLERAYSLGRETALIGDDVRSVDYQTNEDILRRLKNGL